MNELHDDLELVEADIWNSFASTYIDNEITNWLGKALVCVDLWNYDILCLWNPKIGQPNDTVSYFSAYEVEELVCVHSYVCSTEIAFIIHVHVF